MHTPLSRDNDPLPDPGPGGPGVPGDERPRTTADLAFLDHIANTRTKIGHLRRQHRHVTANARRDDLLCELEAWLDVEH